MNKLLETWRLYMTMQMVRICMLGFSSGLILPLTASTLSTYLWDQGINIQTIGILALVAIPYSWKFLWAPLVDNIEIPILGRMLGKRRSWLLIVQGLLILNIIIVGNIDPVHYMAWFVLTMLMLAFLSATQDILIDAFRIEIVGDKDQAAGGACAVLGYRIGMLASGAGALYMAAYFTWSLVFIYVAALMLVGVTAVLLQPEQPQQVAIKNSQSPKQWLEHAFWMPFQNFLQHKSPWLILGLVIFYKLGDAYLGAMTQVFLLEMEFDKAEIATYVKSYGVIATIVGSLLGGYLVKARGYSSALIIGLYVQAISNLVFILQYHNGHDIPTLIFTITVENVTGGIGSAALVGYISHLCNREFTATQYALLSSIASTMRTSLSGTSGLMVEQIGWIAFFIFSAILNIPALCLAYIIFNRKLTTEKPDENNLQQRFET